MNRAYSGLRLYSQDRCTRPMALDYSSCSRAISREKRDTKKMTRVMEERRESWKRDESRGREENPSEREAQRQYGIFCLNALALYRVHKLSYPLYIELLKYQPNWLIFPHLSPFDLCSKPRKHEYNTYSLVPLIFGHNKK